MDQDLVEKGWGLLRSKGKKADSVLPLAECTVNLLRQARSEPPIALLTGMFVHAVERQVLLLNEITSVFNKELAAAIRACSHDLVADPSEAEAAMLDQVHDMVMSQNCTWIVPVLLARTIADWCVWDSLTPKRQESFLAAAERRLGKYRGFVSPDYFLVTELHERINQYRRDLAI